MSVLSRGSNDHEMIGAIGRSGETMARSAGATTLAQPLPGSERADTITIDVAAKLLMITPEWVRLLTKDGWITKTERGRYRVVDVVRSKTVAGPLLSARTRVTQAPRSQEHSPP